MIDGGEGRRLGFELGDEFGGVDRRITRNVVDRFFRIKRRALPAGAFQRVDHMAAHLQHAAFEDGE